MKIKPPIPKCKQCGDDLFDKPAFYYDRRRKYCKVCAEERKHDKDAIRMANQRQECKDARTEKIKRLEQEVEELQQRVELLMNENKSLRAVIIEKRY